jgi:hypothetical protein
MRKDDRLAIGKVEVPAWIEQLSEERTTVSISSLPARS